MSKTERLYYHDSTLLEFSGQITEIGLIDDRYYTVLDRSAFYPTSGGQLFDIGKLDDTLIEEVVETDQGDIRHISKSPVGQPGERVHGVVDFRRRQINRQKHTAQHILSQAFIRLCDANTVSVHLGEEYAAVELDKSTLVVGQLRTAETLTNEIIQKNVPVEIMFIEHDNLGDLPLRKKPARQGLIRIIKTGDFDCSACGGTHCDSTAEVGMIKIIGTEKIRGHTQVKFHAGIQAFEDYAQRLQITSSLSNQFTCHVTDLEGKINKLVEENKTLRRQLAQLQKELLPIQAESLAAKKYLCGNYSMVCEITEGLDTKLVGLLAAQIAERIDGIALILNGDRLVASVHESCRCHAGELVKEFTAISGLNGGGNKSLAQVGGVNVTDLRKYKDIFEKLINAR